MGPKMINHKYKCTALIHLETSLSLTNITLSKPAQNFCHTLKSTTNKYLMSISI